LNYLGPVDYDKDNPEALLVEREMKLTAAATRRKEMSRQVDLMETGLRGVSFCQGRFARKQLKHYTEWLSLVGQIWL